MTTAADHFAQILGMYQATLRAQAADPNVLATGLGIGCVTRAHALIEHKQFDVAHDLIALATRAVLELQANITEKNPDLMRIIVDRIARGHGIEPRTNPHASALSDDELQDLGLDARQIENDAAEDDSPLANEEFLVAYFEIKEICDCGQKATTYGVALSEDDPPVTIWPSCEDCVNDELKKKCAHVRQVGQRAMLVRNDGTLALR